MTEHSDRCRGPRFKSQDVQIRNWHRKIQEWRLEGARMSYLERSSVGPLTQSICEDISDISVSSGSFSGKSRQQLLQSGLSDFLSCWREDISQWSLSTFSHILNSLPEGRASWIFDDVGPLRAYKWWTVSVIISPQSFRALMCRDNFPNNNERETVGGEWKGEIRKGRMWKPTGCTIYDLFATTIWVTDLKTLSQQVKIHPAEKQHVVEAPWAWC